MNFNAMKLPELKNEAKARKIKGFSTMKKADLLEALKLADALDNSAKGNVTDLGDFTQYADAPLSFIDGIKAAIRNAREERSNKGVAAGREATVTGKQTLARKREVYTEDRNGGKLSARQRRRMNKAMRQGALSS